MRGYSCLAKDKLSRRNAGFFNISQAVSMEEGEKHSCSRKGWLRGGSWQPSQIFRSDRISIVVPYGSRWRWALTCTVEGTLSQVSERAHNAFYESTDKVMSTYIRMRCVCVCVCVSVCVHFSWVSLNAWSIVRQTCIFACLVGFPATHSTSLKAPSQGGRALSSGRLSSPWLAW